MSLTKSQEAYKEAIIDNAKPKTTPSPLDDPKIMEATMKVAKEKHGEDKLNEITKEISERYVRNQDFEVDLEDDETIEFSGSKSDLDFEWLFKLLGDTRHLDLFPQIDQTLGLDGDAYLPAKKCLYYFENSIKQPTTVVRINQKVKFDNRGHMLVYGEASSGKSTMKNHVRDICEEDDYHEISGLSHEKQLIGTQVPKGKGDNKTTEVIPGIFSYKVVVNDETQDMLNEVNEMYAKAQRIKRVAMDTFGGNMFNDKNVKTEKEKRLKYCSESRVMDLAHPKKQTSPFYDNGTFRRPSIITILQPDKELKINDITEFSFDSGSLNINMKELLEDFYSKERATPEFTQQTLNVVSLYHKALLIYLLKHKNQNAFRYGLLTRYSLRNMFCKNILILSMSKNEKQVELQTALDGCYDTLLFVLESIKSIDKLGNMSISSDVWGGVSENDAQALEYLYRKGCVDKTKHGVTINKFWTILSHLYGCKVTQARSHFYRLKRDGFVDSRKVGQYGSVVWLKFQPKEIDVNLQGCDGLGGWDGLFQSVGQKNTLLTLSKKVFTDDNTLEKAQSDGSVGVLGCILSKYILCVEPKKIDNLDFLYTYSPQNTAVPTLCPEKTTTATTTSKIQSVKRAENRPTLSNEKDDVETQYFEAEECKDITQKHTKEQVVEFLTSNPQATKQELVAKFGVEVLRFKKEGLFK